MSYFWTPLLHYASWLEPSLVPRPIFFFGGGGGGGGGGGEGGGKIGPGYEARSITFPINDLLQIFCVL